MSDTNAIITLKTCVYSAINRAGIDMKYFEKLYAIAAECLAEINIFHSTYFKVAYLPVSDINTVALPTDYIDYVRPPSLIVNGRIWTLTKLDTLPLQADISCGLPTNPPTDNITVADVSITDYLDYINNVYVETHQYGTSGGQNIAYYRVDKESRLIVLSGNVPGDTVLLEYTSTGLSLEGDTLVPREVMPTIREYLIWQNIENNPTIAMGEKERKKEQYHDQLKQLIHFQNSFSVDEFLDILYGNSRQTPKR